VISLKLALAGLRLGLKNRQVGEKWVYDDCSYLCKGLFNNVHTISSNTNKATSKSIKTMLRAIDKQAQLVEDEIKTLVDNDKQLKHQVKLLLSIDGIGEFCLNHLFQETFA
jgi:ERCC4-type nuclease